MKNRFRRKTLINKSLQLRYMAMVAILMAIIGICTAWIIYYTTWSNLLAELGHIAPLDGLIVDLGRLMLLRTAAIGLACILVGGMITMFVLHRIVGPLFRIKRTMEQIQRGIIPKEAKFKLRTRDELQDLAGAIDGAIQKIAHVSEKNLNIIQEISDCAERAKASLKPNNPQVENVRGELERLTRSIEGFETFKKEL